MRGAKPERRLRGVGLHPDSAVGAHLARGGSPPTAAERGAEADPQALLLLLSQRRVPSQKPSVAAPRRLGKDVKDSDGRGTQSHHGHRRGTRTPHRTWVTDVRPTSQRSRVADGPERMVGSIPLARDRTEGVRPRLPISGLASLSFLSRPSPHQ